MIKKLLILAFSMSVLAGMAGETANYQAFGRSKKGGNNPQNVASLGLLGLGFYNISLKYERSIKPWCSFRVHGGFMIPHSSTALEYVTSASNTEGTVKIENELSGWHVKPEFVFYPGKKGSPKGYYVGVYTKVDKYGITIPVKGDKNDYEGTGSFMRIGGGVIMGYQWLINNKVSIDWWFFGLGVDSYTLSLSSKSKNDDIITEQDKAKIKEDLSSIEKGVTVEYPSSKEVKAIFPSFLFPCVRFGLSVGYAF